MENSKKLKNNLAIIDVPLNLLALKYAINNIEQVDVHTSEIIFSINDNTVLKKFFKSNFAETEHLIHQNKSAYWLISKIIFSYRTRLNNLFVCDLGIKNKLLIFLMRYDNLFILDDGLASVCREQKTTRFMVSCSKSIFNINGKRIINFLSLYKKIYKDQPGFFNIQLTQKAKSNSFHKKCIYIMSSATNDGMSEDENELLTDKIKLFANSIKKDFLMIPHRRERDKFKKNNKYADYVITIDTIFEDFYLSSEFVDCTFVTLYSGAILCVHPSNERYYIRDYFTPKIEKTFINKILAKKIWDINILYDYFDECKIKRLNHEIL